MTNKRKHQLERMVRVEYRHFNHIIYPKEFGINLLEQITRLMFNRIQVLKFEGIINHREACFMRWCVSTYYGYYTKIVCSYFD